MYFYTTPTKFATIAAVRGIKMRKPSSQPTYRSRYLPQNAKRTATEKRKTEKKNPMYTVKLHAHTIQSQNVVLEKLTAFENA